MKILVTGENGRLGSQLVALGCTPAGIDITDSLQIKSITGDVLINCAAYTSVDACETPENYKHAIQVNTGAVNLLRKYFSGRIIHLSTDYVFNGQHGPYSELSQYNNPINAYGFSKWGGEVNMLYPDHRDGDVVVRTTGLYGGVHHGMDFASHVLNVVRNGGKIECASNLRANQTYIPHLAEALMEIAYTTDILPSVLHVASRDIVSRYEFALMLADTFGLDKDAIKPISSNKIVGWVAKRPVNGGLHTGLAVRLGIQISSIRDGLSQYKVEMEK